MAEPWTGSLAAPNSCLTVGSGCLGSLSAALMSCQGSAVRAGYGRGVAPRWRHFTQVHTTASWLRATARREERGFSTGHRASIFIRMSWRERLNLIAGSCSLVWTACIGPISGSSWSTGLIGSSPRTPLTNGSSAPGLPVSWRFGVVGALPRRCTPVMHTRLHGAR